MPAPFPGSDLISMTRPVPPRRNQVMHRRLAFALAAFRTAQALHDVGELRLPSGNRGERSRKDISCVAALARQHDLVLPELVG